MTCSTPIHDIIRNVEIHNKVKNSTTYAQNLYAAICNNIFRKGKEEWTASWRSAGGHIAELRNEGDYLDWYCSGMAAFAAYEVEPHEPLRNFVAEGKVTEEIRNDLLTLGWQIVPYDDDKEENKSE